MDNGTAGPAGAPTGLQSLRRHWRLACAITAISMLLALGYALTRSPVHTAETRLAVGAGEMSTLAIPGFPNASKDLAANYARWVTSTGSGQYAYPAGVEVLASPIAESNVIRIQAKSTDPAQATDVVTKTAEALLAEVNKVRDDNNPDLVLKTIIDNSGNVLDARTEADLTAQALEDAQAEGSDDSDAVKVARAAATAAAKQYTEVATRQDARIATYQRLVSQSTTEADLHTIGQGAAVIGDNRTARVQRFGLLGLGAGVFLALLISGALDRRRRDVAPA